MAISKQELGQRLREARDAGGLTQQQVADRLGLARAVVTQIELGNRDVTGLELERFAFLYGRDLASFFADHFQPEDALTVLLRADADIASDENVADEIRNCVAAGREMVNLESLLEIEIEQLMPPAYKMEAPSGKWDAIQQGTRVAQEERRRMGLGARPINDLTELLEEHGIRAMHRSLPDDVSGMTLIEADDSPLILVNQNHYVMRRRFSYAHEYAHVLLDRDLTGIVSRVQARSELMEVRANAFAAEFLLPEEAVWEFVEESGKGRPARATLELFDEQDVVRAERRSQVRYQSIQLYDLVQLAFNFGVSAITALYRLKNLKPSVLGEEDFERLKAQIESDSDRATAQVLGLPNPNEVFKPRNAFQPRFLSLAVEAFRRELISLAKLRELVELLGVEWQGVQHMLDNAGLGAEA